MYKKWMNVDKMFFKNCDNSTISQLYYLDSQYRNH
uniref:Uncharacterized protein n=1 Tax=Siphoviridae sp. ctvI513 TaxID=2827965 RepID=A0A8S5TJD6_9CAUD|nr:MAG TPA: hypothetical protein [Siphoviridae sp. ctvI513]